MLELNLKLFAAQRNASIIVKEECIQLYQKKVSDFFKCIGTNMFAAHFIVLESLNELMKNAVDAGAENLFIEDRSADRASICVFDDGVGFSIEFLGGNCLNYRDKLGGNLAIASTKRGVKGQYGGSGRGLAEASGVIEQYNGSIICSNRAGDKGGAHMEFISAHSPVTLAEIEEAYLQQRQIFSSPFCQNNTPGESEALVGALLSNVTFFGRAKLSGRNEELGNLAPRSGL